MCETQYIIVPQGHISSLCSQAFWNSAEYYYRAKSATDVHAIQICYYGIEYTILML